jgi:hypothetical protein
MQYLIFFEAFDVFDSKFIVFIFRIHCKPRIAIAVRQFQTDNINRMIIITDSIQTWISVLSIV